MVLIKVSYSIISLFLGLIFNEMMVEVEDFSNVLMFFKKRNVVVLLVFIVGFGLGIVMIGMIKIIKVDEDDIMKKLEGVKF